MKNPKKSILWLDDDFTFDPGRLNIWKRHLKQRQEYLTVIEVGTLNEFVRVLTERNGCEHGNPQFIDALILDVMMKVPSRDATFEQLGFPRKKWLALDAGVQIAGLMQNPNHKDSRPAWLASYVGRKTLLLTSQSAVNLMWAKHLEAPVRDNRELLNFVIKNGDLGDVHVTASQEFVRWVGDVISGGASC